MRQTKKLSASAIFAIILASLVGCAGVHAGEHRLGATGTTQEALPPGAEFATVEAAVISAFTHIRSTSTRSQAERMVVGSIVRTANGYTWTESDHSRTRSRAGWRPKARVALTQDHVATYVVHPRTGDRAMDRPNEAINASEKRLVDQVDPLHRPIFMLAPSDRVVVYDYGAPVVEVADLRKNRTAARRVVANHSESGTSEATSSVALAAGSR